VAKLLGCVTEIPLPVASRKTPGSLEPQDPHLQHEVIPRGSRSLRRRTLARLPSLIYSRYCILDGKQILKCHLKPLRGQTTYRRVIWVSCCANRKFDSSLLDRNASL
jgi:hypothetical protein